MPKQSSSLGWFAATLLFRNRFGRNVAVRPLCEERVVLFRGATEKDARAAAIKYGRAEEHQYSNMYGEWVRWTFAGVEKLEQVDAPSENDGWEVSSRFVRRVMRA